MELYSLFKSQGQKEDITTTTTEEKSEKFGFDDQNKGTLGIETSWCIIILNLT